MIHDGDRFVGFWDAAYLQVYQVYPLVLTFMYYWKHHSSAEFEIEVLMNE